MNTLSTRISRALCNFDSLDEFFEPAIQLVNPHWRARYKKQFAAKVVNIQWETAQCYTLSLKPSKSWKGFEAGQFIELHVEKNGRSMTHCFSVSSSPSDFESTGRIEVSIRAHEQGAITPWLAQHLYLGSTIHISEAKGEFTYRGHNELFDQHHRVFIAGGSGITPFRSMLRQQGLGQNHHRQSNQGQWLSNTTLLYYAPSEAYAIFAEELKALQKHGLNLYLIESDKHGHLCQAHIEKIDADPKHCDVYVCGPGNMIESTKQQFEALGTPSTSIFYEYFGAAPLGDLSGLESDGEAIVVHYEQSQTQTTIDAGNNKQTLLDLAEGQGLKPVSGCRMGVCHQCVCKKTEGRVYNTKTGEYSDTGEEDIQLCLSIPVDRVSLQL